MTKQEYRDINLIRLVLYNIGLDKSLNRDYIKEIVNPVLKNIENEMNTKYSGKTVYLKRSKHEYEDSIKKYSISLGDNHFILEYIGWNFNYFHDNLFLKD